MKTGTGLSVCLTFSHLGKIVPHRGSFLSTHKDCGISRYSQGTTFRTTRSVKTQTRDSDNKNDRTTEGF